MDYNVTALATKKVVKAGSANDGKVYVIVTIENEENDDVREVPVFDKEAQKYLKLISTAKGGLSPTPEDLTIPEKSAIWKNVMDEMYVFPEPMVRVDDNGRPLLNKHGQMYIRNSCRITTRYNVDPQRALLKDANGNPLSIMVPKPGWDKETRGASVMNAFYVPLRTVNAAIGGPAAAQSNDDVIDDMPLHVLSDLSMSVNCSTFVLYCRHGKSPWPDDGMSRNSIVNERRHGMCRVSQNIQGERIPKTKA